LVLKLFGFVLLNWVGTLPGAAQVYWPVFANAGVAFLVAILAAVGVEALASGSVHRVAFAGLAVLGFGLVAFALVGYAHRDQFRFDVTSFAAGNWRFVVVFGLAVTLAALLVRRAVSAGVVAVLVVAELLLLAPHGFYFDRVDPYPRLDWTNKLVALTSDPEPPRVFSVDGLLFPDTAGA